MTSTEKKKYNLAVFSSILSPIIVTIILIFGLYKPLDEREKEKNKDELIYESVLILKEQTRTQEQHIKNNTTAVKEIEKTMVTKEDLEREGEITRGLIRNLVKRNGPE